MADDALARLQAMLRDVPVTWSHATVAYRPMPEDGMPAVGAVTEGLYVAVMHSGITLGAVMGQQIAAEVLNGPSNETADLLAAYRPDRFTQTRA
jgi:glycine/D-amino acid oxidase-like deaminating enzyme